MQKLCVQTYEQPIIEIIEINLDESIAVSGVSSGAGLWEELWG